MRGEDEHEYDGDAEVPLAGMWAHMEEHLPRRPLAVMPALSAIAYDEKGHGTGGAHPMSDTTSEPTTTEPVLEAMAEALFGENVEASPEFCRESARRALRAALEEAGFGADGGYTLDALARLLKAAGIDREQAAEEGADE